MFEGFGFAVVGVQIEALGELGESFSTFAVAMEADGEVEVVVGVGGIGGGGLAEESDGQGGVAVVAAVGDGLVVHDLRQRQDASDHGEGLFGPGVVAGEDEREAAVIACFESGRVVLGDFAEGGCCLLVLLAGELELGGGEPGFGEVGIEVGGLFEMAEALGGIALGEAADVLLEGVEAGFGAGGAEGFFGNAEAGVELAGELPGE